MITRIHVDTHAIRRGDPPITVKSGRTNRKSSHVDIVDACGNVIASIVYRPERPLHCGARVWIETAHSVVVLK